MLGSLDIYIIMCFDRSSFDSRDDVDNFRNTVKLMVTSVLRHVYNCTGGESVDISWYAGHSLACWVESASQCTNLLAMPELRRRIFDAIDARLTEQHLSKAALQRLLTISNASLGPSHPTSLAIEYLLEPTSDNVDDGARRRTCVAPTFGCLLRKRSSLRIRRSRYACIH